jgi:hypothetical protein
VVTGLPPGELEILVERVECLELPSVRIPERFSRSTRCRLRREVIEEVLMWSP